MRYRRCHSTSLFAPIGWLMMQSVRWTVMLPLTLLGYLVRHEARRTPQQTYAAASVIATTPYEWTPYWNEYTKSWEYRLASGTATATFYESRSDGTSPYGTSWPAP